MAPTGRLPDTPPEPKPRFRQGFLRSSEIPLLQRAWLLPRLTALAFGLCMIVGLVWSWRSLQPKASLQARIQAHIQADLNHALQMLAEGETPRQFLPSQLEVPELTYSPEGQLTHWNSNWYIPNDPSIRTLLARPESRVWLDKNHAFFVHRHDSLGWVRLRLLPLWINFPIENNYLHDFIFIGRYQQAWSNDPPFHANNFFAGALPNSLQFHDPSSPSKVLFSIRPDQLQPFRVRAQIRALIWLSLSLGLGLGLVWWTLRRRWARRPWLAGVVVLGGLVVLRFLAFGLHFPNLFVQSPLFSPAVLALNDLNPSLGDLLLNSTLLLVLMLFAYRHLPLRTWALRIERGSPSLRMAFVLGAWWILAGITFQLYRLFPALVTNTTLVLEIHDLTQFDSLSAWVYVAIALLVSAGLVVQIALIQFVKPLLTGGAMWFRLGAIGLLLGVCGVLWIVGWGSLRDLGIWLSFVLLLLLLAQGAPGIFRWPLPTMLVLVAGLAAQINYPLFLSLEAHKQANLQLYADKYASRRDLVTESLFNNTIQHITNDTRMQGLDTLALDRAPLPHELLSYLIREHLLNPFRGYDIRLFAFGANGRRLDDFYEFTPYRYRPDDPNLESTLSRRFFLVPDPKSLTRYIYVGRIPIETRKFGTLQLQLELIPKASVTRKLYPQLLLSEGIRSRMSLPHGYEIGIYHEGKLVKYLGQGNLSETYPLEIPESPQRFYAQLADNLYYLYVNRQDAQRVVVVRAAQATWFERITSFSFLFYLFLLVWLVLLLIRALSRTDHWHPRWQPLRFATRVQVFLLLFSLLPLLAMWLLTMPLLSRFFYQDAERSLLEDLQRVRVALEAQPALLRDLAAPRVQFRTELREVLNQASSLTSHDVNLFNRQGELYASTTPLIYQTGLTSSYMHPQALDQLRLDARAHSVVLERIGTLQYLSGYIPLMDGSLNRMGYLNIPFLTQQSLVDQRIQQLLTYLINIYVITILILIVVSLFISRTLTQPLKLLQARLAATHLGEGNEPIEWKGEDEIGELIRSYNAMLAQLDASRHRLAQTERELAWREMARQVAHEIKNPLTPMKLSVQHLQRALGRDADPRIARVAATLLGQIDSLTAIANSFSQFTAMPGANAEPVELRSLMQEIYQLYAHSEQAEVTLRLPPDEAAIWIQADKNQVMRSIINLVRNGLQAMPEYSRPDTPNQLTIRLEREGNMAHLTIEDNGTGIPEAIRERVFEPNFSTKTSGMGLGLALTRRMVEGNGGQISFVTQTRDDATQTNNTTTGTTFSVRFPILADHTTA